MRHNDSNKSEIAAEVHGKGYSNDRAEMAVSTPAALRVEELEAVIAPSAVWGF